MYDSKEIFRTINYEIHTILYKQKLSSKLFFMKIYFKNDHLTNKENPLVKRKL